MQIHLTATVLSVLLAVPAVGSADPVRLFESGTPGANGQTHGYSIGDSGFTGLRFFVPVGVITTQIGGHFGGLGGADIFGAIVALAGPSDLPDSFDLSTADLRGAARIVLSPSGAPVPSRVFSAPLEVGLTPGWYALVFGSGLFGATGTALFTLDNLPMIGQTIIGSGGVTRNFEWSEGDLTVNRLYAFVDGAPAPIPEPSTLLLLGGGLAALLRQRRCRRIP